ncbi:GntR family transcriptional regulator [Pseudomonas sp. J452]|uniref:FadR/GntR family transcriptional regulator n=1 Tax=Pseudomonas sp. J452 TaxID=2898441 RepID=UPI0021ADC4CB|nr:GntR family transcriptional regulator [Pseudomonas sp. J452]UUY09329.1 GntR family transcriptional regulator [Pseudomonas sp. J452]
MLTPVATDSSPAPSRVHDLRRAALKHSGRQAKLAELVAEAMQKDIAALGWPVGSLLGSEAQLMERYRISRATLREAIRQLERNGVASMRRGAGGGLIVRQPAKDSAALALATYLELTDVSFAELFEARELIECLIVSQAAEQLSDSDIGRARQLIDLLRHTPPCSFNEELQLHGQVRELICQVAANPAISLIYVALCYVTINGRTPQRAHVRARLEQAFSTGRQLKLELLECIVAGDAQRAQDNVRDSLRQLRELIVELSGSLQKGPTSDMSSLQLAPDFAIRKVYEKTAHRLAVVIARSIANSGLRAGARLGAEPDLQALHQVSRAVLREAVRTLELHAIVRSRRGQGGGLIVETPDPSYTIKLLLNYLRHNQLPRHYFYSVWKTLQLTAAGLTAQRLDSQGRARLQQLQAATAAARLSNSRELDLCIAELSGNRALALFSHVFGAMTEHDPLPEALADKLRDSQTQRIQALLARDPSLARRSMLRYFQLLEGAFDATAPGGSAG